MIKILCIGKIKEVSLSQLIQEYLKRISGFSRIEVVELAESKQKDAGSQGLIEQIKRDEGTRLLKQVHDDDFVILLDLQGEMMTSEGFSAMQAQSLGKARKDCVYVIGGSHGVSDEVKERSQKKICFSKMTFPHQLIRLFLTEQIYRGFMIENNRQYHK